MCVGSVHLSMSLYMMNLHVGLSLYQHDVIVRTVSVSLRILCLFWALTQLCPHSYCVIRRMLTYDTGSLKYWVKDLRPLLS